MGYADNVYCARKARTHARADAGVPARPFLRGAPLVEHDFHLLPELPQAQRGCRFWLACHWVVTGPERPAPASAGLIIMSAGLGDASGR